MIRWVSVTTPIRQGSKGHIWATLESLLFTPTENGKNMDLCQKVFRLTKRKKVWAYKSGIVCPRKWFLKWHNFINRIWTINFILICFFDASCPRTKQGADFFKGWPKRAQLSGQSMSGTDSNLYSQLFTFQKSHVILLKQAQRGLRFQLSKQFVDGNPLCLWTAGCDTQDIFYNKD